MLTSWFTTSYNSGGVKRTLPPSFQFSPQDPKQPRLTTADQAGLLLRKQQQQQALFVLYLPVLNDLLTYSVLAVTRYNTKSRLVHEKTTQIDIFASSSEVFENSIC